MSITARYDDVGTIVVTTDGRRTVVPDDMSNRYRRKLAEWEAQGNTIAPYVEPPIKTDDENDTETLNVALSRKGNVVRALALVTLQEINKLRVANGDAAYTLAQFKAALKLKMRNGE
jgi:hypothetical protein